jgi:hypothetical protein
VNAVAKPGYHYFLLAGLSAYYKRSAGVRVMPTPETTAQPIIVAIMTLLTAGHRSPNDGPSLSISGGATTSALPAAFYSFTPTVVHNGSRTLKYTIKNKPAWASFGKKYGTLYGTPSTGNVGTYPNIMISVSDGSRTVELPAFSITVGLPLTAAVPSP